MEATLKLVVFNLRKWISNDPEVFGEAKEINQLLYFIPNEDMKVLGVKWSSKTDQFGFSTLEIYKSEC